MKISNVWALTATEVCSALNKVRAMKVGMAFVWIVILIQSEGFGGNTVLVLRCFNRQKGTIYAYVKNNLLKM